MHGLNVRLFPLCAEESTGGHLCACRTPRDARAAPHARLVLPTCSPPLPPLGPGPLSDRFVGEVHPRNPAHGRHWLADDALIREEIPVSGKPLRWLQALGWCGLPMPGIAVDSLARLSFVKLPKHLRHDRTWQGAVRVIAE